MKKVVGVTACAAGIAHTYMAQAALEKGAKELGLEAKIETQGSIGVENQLTREEIEAADLVIIAADVNVDRARFVGKRMIDVDTNAVIKDAKTVIEKAEKAARVYGEKGSQVGIFELGTSTNKFVRYLMSGLSDMIPVTIAAGLLLAFANMFAFHPDPKHAGQVIWAFSTTGAGPFLSQLFNLGKVGFTLMIPIFAAGVARAIGDKPAVAPAFIAAYIINDPTFLSTKTGAGFLGAIVVGLGVGYFVKLLKKIPWPKALMPIVPIMIIPLVTTFLSFVIIYFFIGHPIAIFMSGLYDLINHITVTYKAAPILYGAILGGMMGVDMGGPINKTALLVGSAIFVDTMAKYGPAGVNAIPQAATTAAISVAPLGAALATILFRKMFTTEEKALGSSAIVMGAVGVTEGAIPFAAAHPQLILANTISSALAGGIVAGMGLEYYGGIGSPLGAFVGYVTGPHWAWLLWIIGICIAIVVNALLYWVLLHNRKDIAVK